MVRAQDDGAAVTGPPSKIMVIRIITLDGDLRGFRYSRGYRFRPSSVENFHKFGSVLRVLPPNAERQLPSEFGRGRMGCATGIYRVCVRASRLAPWESRKTEVTHGSVRIITLDGVLTDFCPPNLALIRECFQPPSIGLPEFNWPCFSFGLAPLRDQATGAPCWFDQCRRE
jgi:hypothetical protein